MNSLTVVVLCAAVVAANAGLLGGALVAPVADSTVVQGPSASAEVVGPDGSVIASTQPGGTVVASTRSGSVAAHGIIGHAGIVAAPGVVAARFAGPAVVAHHGAVVGAPGVIAARAGFLGGHLGYPFLAPGSGIEGQYVHDYTENLYDNGQYHGEIYP